MNFPIMITTTDSIPLPAALPRLLLLLIAGLGLAHLPGRAAEPAPIPAGRYALDHGSLDSLEEALAKAAAQFKGMQRQMAARRLRERAVPPAEIEITMSDAGLALRLGDNRFPAMQPGSKPVGWSTKEGRDAEVSLRWEGASLVHEIALEDRTRRSTLTFDPKNKTLRLGVHFNGSRLRHPVVFTLRYLPLS